MGEPNHLVVDGQLAYYNEGPHDHYIRFPFLNIDLPDAHGFPRLDGLRLVRDGRWLTSNALNWLMNGLRATHSWQFEAFHWTGIDRLDGSRGERLTEVDPPFRPGSGRQAIIVRIVNIGNAHWVAIAHFHTLNRFVFFDSYGTTDKSRSDADSTFSIALESQRRIISGSQAEPQQGVELSVACQTVRLQKDTWSCGLWCMGFIRTIIELLSERRALDGEEVNYGRLLLTLQEEMNQGRIVRFGVEEAHRLARMEWVSHERPNNVY